jgi:4-carboxymuconolactone decarboxylase
MDERERFHKGMEVRRAVLGDAHVERAQAKLSAFNQELQDMITRHAWGEIWTRPGLPRHTRSLITMAMLIALHRDEELRLHVRGALANGVTEDEMKELLLHSSIYCGLPAAHAAFRLVEDMLAAIAAETPR